MPLGNDRGSNQDLLAAIAAGAFTLVTNAVIPNNKNRFSASQVVTYVYIKAITNRTSTELPRWDELIAIAQGSSSNISFADEVGPLQYVAHDLQSTATYTFNTVLSGTTYVASGTLPASRNYDFTVSSVTGISTFSINNQGTATSVQAGSLPSYNFTTVSSGNTTVTAKSATVAIVTTATNFNGPNHAAYHPGTGNIFVSNLGDRSLKTLNTASNTMTLTVPLPAYMGGSTATGSNARGVIYVLSIDRIWVKDEADYIYEYNPYTNTFKTLPVVTPSDLGSTNYGYEMVYVPDIGRVFNFLLNSSRIDVINPSNYAITNTISLATLSNNNGGVGIIKPYTGVAPGNGFCYVCTYTQNYFVINVSTLTVVNNLVYSLTTNSRSFMTGIVYYNGSDSPDSLVIVDTGLSQLYNIKGASTPSSAVIVTGGVSNSPQGIIYSPVRNVFYVGYYQNPTSAVSTYSTTISLTSTLTSGLSPVYTVYNPANSKVYALNYASNSVTILT